MRDLRKFTRGNVAYYIPTHLYDATLKRATSGKAPMDVQTLIRMSSLILDSGKVIKNREGPVHEDAGELLRALQ